MPLIILFFIYNILQILTLPFFVLYLIYRKLANKNIFGSLRERIGLIPKTPKNKNVVWFHAVSVGEVLSIQHIIKQIKVEKPDVFIYLTVGTLAGRQMAQKNVPADIISFIPYDFLPCMMLALQRIKPNNIFIIEAEIWPNLLILSSWFEIKKTLINARVSMRSFGRYKILKFIFTPLFNSFNKIYTQSEQDKLRFITLNVNPEIINVLGDIKTFNVYQKWTSIKNSNHIHMQDQNKILLAGSIHPGELDTYIKLFKNLKPKFPDLKMILAPRHFHWMNELETKIKIENISYFMWTTQNSITDDPFNANDLLIVCKLGELFNLYKMCNIFYLGGTFVNIGGHNLLEPAVWSKACITGPYHQNTQNIADQLQNAGGLIKVENFEQLLTQSQNLLSNQDLCIKMGSLNFEWLENQVVHIKSSIQNIISRI